MVLFWDRELLRAVACSQLVAQFSGEEVEKMKKKANVFMEQLKMVKTVTTGERKVESEVTEAMPTLAPAPSDEGKPVCSFDYEDAAKQRDAAVEKWEKGARAAVSPRGSIAEEMTQTQAAVWPRGGVSEQEPLIQEMPHIFEERGVKTKRPEGAEQQEVPPV